jgi:hypothetical protein
MMLRIQMKSNLLHILILSLLSTNLTAQSTNGAPQVLNIGGGSNTTSSVSLEWSIGESSSINSFTSGIWQMYTGVLQTSTLYPFIRNIDVGQIKLGPNPFRDKIKVETAFKTKGKIGLTVYDNYGRTVYIKEVNSSSEYLNETLTLNKLLNGIYYLEIIYTDHLDQKKRSLNKIIKY